MLSIDQFLLEMNQNDEGPKLRNEWYHGIHFLINWLLFYIKQVIFSHTRDKNKLTNHVKGCHGDE